MEMLRLYHRIWRLPDGLYNRSCVVRTASNFGFAVRPAEVHSLARRNVLICRHTQVTGRSLAQLRVCCSNLPANHLGAGEPG